MPGEATREHSFREEERIKGECEASWSADAFGKSKTPGWYHTSRKELYQHRAKLASSAPKGVYTSHSKYADEDVRIKNTGRLAF